MVLIEIIKSMPGYPKLGSVLEVSDSRAKRWCVVYRIAKRVSPPKPEPKPLKRPRKKYRRKKKSGA